MHVSPDSLEHLLVTPHARWLMSLGERVTLEGFLALLKPSVAIEIGTAYGGSLACIARHSRHVHSFDRVLRPEVRPESFPHVTWHVGDSHELLPGVLDELAAASESVDFVLVDGDHSAHGVERDVTDLLSSPALRRTVILIHDTLNERVRAGLEQIPWSSFEAVRLVDLDLLPGQLFRGGSFADELWGGFGLVLVRDRPVDGSVMRLEVQDVPDVYDAYLSAGAGTLAGARATYHEITALERQVLRLEESVRQLTTSRSWRLTAPLRLADERLRQLFRRG
jgi:hypothetical protein